MYKYICIYWILYWICDLYVCLCVGSQLEMLSWPVTESWILCTALEQATTASSTGEPLQTSGYDYNSSLE